MDISLCIVNWNTRDLLRNCIASVLEKTHGVSYEIIIVDNNSADGSAEMVRKQYPMCRLIASKKNLGFSMGNNLGLREATGKYILFLNPDTILATNALQGMFQLLESRTEVGAVGCKLLNQDDSIQYICARTYPTLFNQFCYLMLLNRLFPRSRLFSTIEMGYWDHGDSREVDCLSGACILARKQLIDKLQGFDENLFMYAEDVDLCYRIKEAGWKIYYLASEAIYHLEGQSSKKQSQRHFAAIAQKESSQYFFRKHYGKAHALLYSFVIFVGSAFRISMITASVLDFRGRRHSRDQRKYIFMKYGNLVLWSLGLRKVHSSRS